MQALRDNGLFIVSSVLVVGLVLGATQLEKRREAASAAGELGATTTASATYVAQYAGVRTDVAADPTVVSTQPPAGTANGAPASSTATTAAGVEPAPTTTIVPAAPITTPGVKPSVRVREENDDD